MQAEEKTRDAGLLVNFIAQDIEMASFPKGSFDYILCSSGMAYLQHPEATLRRFRGWLREGGKLCFNNPLVRQSHFHDPLFYLTDSNIINAWWIATCLHDWSSR